MGTMTPCPPRQAGNERSSRSVGPNVGWPVKAGKNKGSEHHQKNEKVL